MTTPTSQRTRSLSQIRSDLETPGPSATTSTLELATLALNIGLLVCVRTHAKVLDSLAGVLGATEEESVGTSRSPQGKLVNSENLTTRLFDAGTCGSGDTQSSDGELGKFYAR
jgi:hypothetical protein